MHSVAFFQLNAAMNVRIIIRTMMQTAIARVGSAILFICLIGPRRKQLAPIETIVPIEYSAANPENIVSVNTGGAYKDEPFFCKSGRDRNQHGAD